MDVSAAFTDRIGLRTSFVNKRALTTKHIVYTLASVLSSVGVMDCRALLSAGSITGIFLQIAAAFIIVWSIFSRIFPKGTVYIAVGFIVILPVCDVHCCEDLSS